MGLDIWVIESWSEGDLTLEYWFLNIYPPLMASSGRRFPSPHFILFISKEEEDEGDVKMVEEKTTARLIVPFASLLASS